MSGPDRGTSCPDRLAVLIGTCGSMLRSETFGKECIVLCFFFAFFHTLYISKINERHRRYRIGDSQTCLA